jgi:hypothetical protein
MGKSSHRIVFGGAGLVLCACVAVSLWLPRGAPIPAVSAGSEAPHSTNQVAIELAQPMSTAAERETVRSAEPESTTAREPRIVVRGAVLGPVPDLESVQVGIVGSCRVRQDQLHGKHALIASKRPAVDVAVDSSGRFESDVTDLIGQCPAREPELLIVAKHRSSKLATLTVQPRMPPTAGVGTAVDGDPIVTEVQLELVLGTLLTGRVSVEGSEPHGAISLVTGKLESFSKPLYSGSRSFESETSKWAFEEDLPPWTFLASQQPQILGADGAFEVQVEPGGRYAVVASAAGYRPATAVVDVLVEGLYRVDLTMHPGADLSGTLRLGPELAEPGTHLTARLLTEATDTPTLHSDAGDLTWIGAAYESSRALAVTDAGGGFIFRGLAPGRYEVSAIGEGMVRRHVRTVRVGIYSAPGSNLQLGPCLARVELDLGRSESGPTAFKLELLGQGGMPLGPFETDATGLATLHLRPRSSYEVLVAGSSIGRVATAEAGATSSWRAPR